MALTITHYLGASFRLAASYLDDEGAPKSLTGKTVTAELRGPGGPYPLSVAVLDAEDGAFVMTATPTVANDWPKGAWPLFVTYTGGPDEVEIEQPVRVHVRELP